MMLIKFRMLVSDAVRRSSQRVRGLQSSCSECQHLSSVLFAMLFVALLRLMMKTWGQVLMTRQMIQKLQIVRC